MATARTTALGIAGDRDRAGIDPVAGPDALPADPWDRFLAGAPGGDLVQSSAWAATKRALGFETEHVVVRDGPEILGGAQIIVRRFGPLGRIGYIARGPVVAQPGAIAVVLDRVEAAARAARVRHLIVQPPEGGRAVAEELARRDYAPDAPPVAPTATLRIDLGQGLDRVLAAMTPERRRQVRRLARGELEVGLGTRDDLATFHGLLAATAARQGFTPVSLDYLHRQWDVLRPSGSVAVIMARHEDRPVSAIWCTAFAGTVTFRLPGWNGEAGRLQPNVACQWQAIAWAHGRGFRRYDFGGIDRRCGEALVRGEPVPDDLRQTPASFKTAFGGTPTLFPLPLQKTFNPLAHRVLRAVQPRLSRSRTVRRLIDRARDR